MSNTPHDALFKLAFREPKNAAAQLKAILPAGLARRIDWSTLKLISGEMTDKNLQQFRADLVFEVQSRGRPLRLTILFEHQSSAPPDMPLRLLGYATRLYELQWKANPGAPLIPVIPVVLYHGPKGWSSPRLFPEMFDLGDASDIVAPYVPSFDVVLDDLAEVDDEALRQRALTALGLASLIAFQRVNKSPEPEVVWAQWQRTLLEVLDAPHGVDAMAAIVRYTVTASEGIPSKIRRFFIELGPKGEEAYMTAADKLIEEERPKILAEERPKILAEGRAEGRAQGRAQGRAEGQVDILKRLLQKRFGPLPETVERKLESADEGELERLTDEVLSAASLDELLGAD